ncbi:hypothetical protein [Sphingomonas adhaesiva]|uniref:hypothetical protein n=1 Tax=Sphingomonas adhaesiva TaxID=28212 RepID=UPI002FF87500
MTLGAAAAPVPAGTPARLWWGMERIALVCMAPVSDSESAAGTPAWCGDALDEVRRGAPVPVARADRPATQAGTINILLTLEADRTLTLRIEPASALDDSQGAYVRHGLSVPASTHEAGAMRGALARALGDALPWRSAARRGTGRVAGPPRA